MNDEKWSSNLLSLYLPNCLLFRSLHSLFHLVSIHFHFGTPPPAKKNNFWCSHQMSHYLRWVILLRIFLPEHVWLEQFLFFSFYLVELNLSLMLLLKLGIRKLFSGLHSFLHRYLRLLKLPSEHFDFILRKKYFQKWVRSKVIVQIGRQVWSF